jgi:hypothetical protein
VNLDFSDNPITLKNAFDDIIKLNCLINEFNYINDLAKQMKHKLMPEVLKRNGVDWISLFDHFDTDKKGLITKIEIKGMI